MGPDRTQKLIARFCVVIALGTPAFAQEAGWHYSPLPGEGDRATLGCDREATPDAFTCLAIRCEDDFSTGVYVHSSRAADMGRWELTIDRENASVVAGAGPGPYGGKFTAEAGWLLERLAQGSFVYLRHTGDLEGPFHFIDLTGSLHAINQALAWCAPRKPAGASQKDEPAAAGHSRQ